jgi:membrane protein DedA with SNARE-associated domain
VLLASVTSSVTSYVRDHGVYAVFVLMMIDAVFPAFSELVMIVGGALAAGAFGASVTLFGYDVPQGFRSYLVIALAGTIGYLVGSIAGWWIGLRGGRPLLESRGRWFHLTPGRLERAEAWFDRWEDWAVFFGRITPVVRSFVSIPAGIFRVPFTRYTLLTLAGSAVWCFAFAAIGWVLGSSYKGFNHAFGFVEILVVAGVLVLVGYLVLRRRRSTTIS